MRSEYTANQHLTPKCEKYWGLVDKKSMPSWVKPSTCKRARPIPWYTRLWVWFKRT